MDKLTANNALMTALAAAIATALKTGLAIEDIQAALTRVGELIEE